MRPWSLLGRNAWNLDERRGEIPPLCGVYQRTGLGNDTVAVLDGELPLRAAPTCLNSVPWKSPRIRGFFEEENQCLTGDFPF